MKKLAPSILSANFGNLYKDVYDVALAGADLIHIDVMDGNFVPNITIGPQVISSIRGATDKPFDVHLMINEPERYVIDFADAGADIITIHVESTKHVHRVVQLIKSCNVKAGLAVNPGTPIQTVLPLIDVIDLVCIMTVNPGFGGQQFIRQAVFKLSEITKFNPCIMYEVDGGINKDTIELAANYGANVFVAGSAVFNTSGTLAENITLLKSCW